MTSTEKDRLAAEVTKCWQDFQKALSAEKRKYPFQQFKTFWTAPERYAELTKSDSLISPARRLRGQQTGRLPGS